MRNGLENVMNNVDMTPTDYMYEGKNSIDSMKDYIRFFMYTPYTFMVDKWIKYKYRFLRGYDKAFMGQRGNDYFSHRVRLNRYHKISGSNVLIIGCGAGRDVESWVLFRPSKIIAVDLFNYEKAWSHRKRYFKDKYGVDVEFIQSNVHDMREIESESIDIVGSDAVLEHLNNFSHAIKEIERVMVNGGTFYSTFGPLWNAWGGDHVSGQGDLSHGYNHLLLDEKDYEKYLESYGSYDSSSSDSRMWIYNDLFSYYKPVDYINELSIFNLLWVSVIIDPRSIKFLKTFEYKKNMLFKKGVKMEDLMISGMTIIVKKHDV